MRARIPSRRPTPIRPSRILGKPVDKTFRRTPFLPKQNESSPSPRYLSILSKMGESAASILGTGIVLGLAGYTYHKYYKWLILHKMEYAFRPGDPALEIAGNTSTLTPRSADSPSTSSSGLHHDGASTGNDTDEHVDEKLQEWAQSPDQARLDAIVGGEERGRYYLLIGEKGTGKSSMLLEAMRKVDGEGISMFEAHADLEVFRVRLGKALNYEYHEDYIGALFSVRGPRDTTALLDIERAFNKLEKIALARRAQNHSGLAPSWWARIATLFRRPRSLSEPRHKGPLVLIVNCTHLIRDDEDGKDLLELMQQRAEQWAASNLITMIFNSDDYWVYERLKRMATRMEVMPILDLPKDRAISALARYRQKYFPRQDFNSSEILERVYDRVGGRMAYLNRVAKSKDMLQTCDDICKTEKTWFLNQCGILGESMDDDVMDQQKFASAAMVLARALVESEKEMKSSQDSIRGHLLPQIPLYRAREIMTRADFIQQYDSENIFTIDSNAMVRADSVPMMNAFREICAEEGFDQYLQDTLDRISAIESLQRTKELTLKDLWIEQAGEQRGRYSVVMKDSRGKETGSIELTVRPNEEAEEG